MKRGIVGGLVAVLMLAVTAGAARAQDEMAKLSEWVSGNVAVTTDYAFRGISQTLEEPAIQGGMDFEHPSGLYLGFWGSSVNFGEDLDGGPRAQAEMDIYGGFGFSAAQILDVDLGAIYYAYPGSDGRGYDFIEYGIGASRSLSMLDAGLSLAYSPDYFGESGEAFYYGAGVSVPVSLLTVSGSLGHQTIDKNEIFGTPDYTDFSIGLGVGVAGFDVSGQWVDTDLEEDECFGGSDLCSSRFIFSISRAL